jgi:class 3 adenylate cyclase
MTAPPPDGQNAPSDPDPVKAARRLARENERLRATLTHLEQMRDTNARTLDRVRSELDALLLNVFPKPIIDRLNAGETLIADRHDDVTVLFSDLVGFTEISSWLPVAELVAGLNALFSSFDASCDRFGVEKIKTIGDAYLAVAGLHGSDGNHATACADLALAMVEAVRDAGPPWQIRIGIHRGPVVAGVIGQRKYVYDVWGDTVNVASRLETSSDPGRIQISDAVAQGLGEAFPLERRGAIELKGKGPIDTYFLIAV